MATSTSKAEIEEGTFSEDLLQRMNSIPVENKHMILEANAARQKFFSTTFNSF